MTEAWKSNKRKFCNLCKCWFADNPVSIRFHENGQRHKENVKNKLRELGQKGTEKEKESRELNGALAQMERGAIASFKRDIQDNPELEASYNIHQNIRSLPVQPAPRVSVPTPMAPKGRLYPGALEADVTPDSSEHHLTQMMTSSFKGEGSSCKLPTAGGVAIPPPSRDLGGQAPPAAQLKKKVWAESVTEDGTSYYWHTLTGETTWEPPVEGFLTLHDQEIIVKAEEAGEDEDSKLSPESSTDHRHSTVYNDIMKAVEDSAIAKVQPEDSTAGSFTSATSTFSMGAAPIEIANIPLPSSGGKFERCRDRSQPNVRHNAKQIECSSEGYTRETNNVSSASTPESADKPAATLKAKVEPKTEPDTCESTGKKTELGKRKNNPYGSWTTVQSTEVQSECDNSDYDGESAAKALGLPKNTWKEYAEAAASIPDFYQQQDEETRKSKVKFQEKTVSSGGMFKGKNAPPGEFKKRKIAVSARNTRTRNDDD